MKIKELYSASEPLWQVLVDVNWRPVFFSDELAAPAVIKPYVERADIVKVTDEEAEWLWGIPAADALQHPEKVCLRALTLIGRLTHSRITCIQSYM